MVGGGEGWLGNIWKGKKYTYFSPNWSTAWTKKYLTGRENLDFSPGPHTILFSRDKVLVSDWSAPSADDFSVVSNKTESTNNKW